MYRGFGGEIASWPAIACPRGNFYEFHFNLLNQAGSKSRQALVGEVWGEEGGSFPLSCLAAREEDGDSCHLTLWTYSSLSGLLLLDKEGKVSQGEKGRQDNKTKQGERGRPRVLLLGPGFLTFWFGRQKN